MFSFNTLIEFYNAFPDEQSCIDYLEKSRWGDIVISPFDPTSKVYKCKGNRYKCKNTGKYFNVRTGTIFENSKVSLRKWMLASYFIVDMKRGVSSIQLSKLIGVTQKTAWFMIQRIQNCFNIEIEEPCLEGEIEVDETYVGGKNKNKHSSKKVKNAQGRSLKDKTPVFGMVQREGFVVAYVVTDTKGKTLLPLIYETVHTNSIIYSDEWYAYNGIDKEKFDHQKVYHKIGAYVIGRRSTNTIEGYWSHLKRMISGTHFWVSRKHLQRYVDCESFRYNTKHLSESERFDVLLQNIHRRLRYSELIGN
ncbi:IS1595 family transposase [Parabacteroides faecis]|uniref:IS1595 family transposase n=1 Tax=Parabacteroides faecis TaxID=1217282 RepID=UPI003522FE80